MRTLLASLIALTTAAHAAPPSPGAPPLRADAVLQASTGCEIDALGALIASSQAVVNAPGNPPAPAALAAITEARGLWTRSNELYAANQTALAYSRARGARRALRPAMAEVWTRTPPPPVGAAVSKLVGCTGDRITHTARVFSSHALVGPRTAWDKARARHQVAATSLRRGDVRMSYLSAEDALHQLDSAITRQWPETK